MPILFVRTAGAFLKRNRVLIFLLLLQTTIIIKNINIGELHLNNDETRHAMTGVFVYDLIRDFPIKNPVDYAYKYYARYPALGIIHWPPFFYFVEAGFYFLFGISIISAKLTVLLFSLLLTIYWFKLIEQIYDRNIAFFSSLLLLTLEPFVLYSESVMLEIPVLSLTIISIFYFNMYLETNRRRDLYLCILAVGLALITKQTAFFLLPLFFVYLLLTGNLKRLLTNETLIAMTAAICLIMPHYVYAFKLHSSVLLSDLTRGTIESPGFLSSDRYLYYVKALPGQIGFWILICCIVFVLHLFLHGRYKNYSFFLIWIFVCYLLFTLIAQKSNRHNMYYLPPLILIGVCGINALPYRIGKAKVSLVVLIFLSIWQIGFAYNYQRPFIKGYEEAAKHVVKDLRDRIVLFDGHLEGNFIFYARKYDPKKQMVILRANKMLYSFNVFPDYGLLKLANNENDIFTLLNDYGIKYIVAESKDFEAVPINEVLSSLLKTNNFELVRVYPITSNVSAYNDLKLLIYEYKNHRPITKKELKLHLLTLDKVLSVQLDSLLAN